MLQTVWAPTVSTVTSAARTLPESKVRNADCIYMMIVPGSRTDSFNSLCGSTIVPFRNTSSCRSKHRTISASLLQGLLPGKEIVLGQAMQWTVRLPQHCTITSESGGIAKGCG